MPDEWSAEVLGEPRLLGLVRDGSAIYAWPYDQRRVWHTELCRSQAGHSNASHGLAEPGGGADSRFRLAGRVSSGRLASVWG